MGLDDLVFLDVEADRNGRPLVIGAVRGNDALRIDVRRGYEPRAASELNSFVSDSSIAGHNLVAFDLPLLQKQPICWSPRSRSVLDTLILSMLADPTRTSHALDKSDHPPGQVPDPVADARRARQLALSCIAELGDLPREQASFYASLLALAGHPATAARVAQTADLYFGEPRLAARSLPEALLSRLCRVHLQRLLERVADGDAAESLALALAVRFVELAVPEGRIGRPPSPMLAMLPRFTEILTRLLGPLCPDLSCAYGQRCEVHRPFAEEILRANFELVNFRPQQEAIIHAVLDAKYPLAVLPTGGGKSLCYQLPAVHGAQRLRGLTLIVSPLQALMADQVRALSTRYTGTCFINSQLTMAERQQNLSGIRSGKYSIVYLGPEQLRSPTLVRLLRNRPPFLWVIDEAHCISQWGHSFRTDYTYMPRAIAQIHSLENAGSHGMPPLLALFTATATAEVRRDITEQLRHALGIAVDVMDFAAKRENLEYDVIVVQDERRKSIELINLLEATATGARLVYCATVRAAREVAEMLREYGIACALYHGRLPPREKKEELERFLSGAVRTVVATSAFGMGIDKPDIRLVVHYELSGSLEDYIQETGRAGRDGAAARCVLLYSEADVETQFYLKSAARVSARDVRFVFQALRARARRVARTSGNDLVEQWVVPEDLFAEERLDVELDWDRDELGSKLKLVLYHLEADRVLERRENRTRVFGIFPALASLELAVEALPENVSPATRRVLGYLYDPERPRRVSVLDIADEAGLLPKEAFHELTILSRLGLVTQELAFDVTLAHAVAESSRDVAARHFQTLDALFSLGEDLDESPVVQLRSAAARIAAAVGRSVPPHELFHTLRALRRQGLLRLDKVGAGRYRVRFDHGFLRMRDELLAQRRTAESLLEYAGRALGERRGRDVVLELDVERFLREAPDLYHHRSSEDVVDACLLLHHLEAWHLSDPPVVLETAMRVGMHPGARVSDLDLNRPRVQYEHDVALVHLLREYALMPSERRQQFVDDYFAEPREAFVEKYFQGRKRALRRSVSPQTEERLLAGLTPAQRAAVTSEDRALLVVAGPGSGKTFTVVRRIAYMIRARQVRPEEILVLAFSRAAAAELRERLTTELGPRALRVGVRTFHGLALRLTGADLREDAVDADQVLDEVLARAADLLMPPAPDAASEGSTPPDPTFAEELRLRVLGPVRHVIVDEYQDLDADQYRLLTSLVGLQHQSRGDGRTERTVYVVGDDDQAIYGFRDASVEFLRRFESEFAAHRICLSENFRSNARIVAAGALFASKLPGRMKTAPEEQIRAAPTTGPGTPQSLRRFRYGSYEELSAHAAFIVAKSLKRSDGASHTDASATSDCASSIAILARNWSSLHDVRFLLEAQSLDLVIHQRGFHRPVHRRHPAFRAIRHLWDAANTVETPAVEHLQTLFRDWNRSLDEAPVRELLQFAERLDQERLTAGGRWIPISTKDLADELLLESRDHALRDCTHARDGVVHLSTFHSSKGLEFDKVIVLPSRPKPSLARDEDAEERRAFYVAMTRARHELVLTTLGESGELALDITSEEQDLRGVLQRLRAARAAYLDCDPADVVLTSPELARAQRVIYDLREGMPLEVDHRGSRSSLLHEGTRVGILSEAGQHKLNALRRRVGDKMVARVHEIFVHIVRSKSGAVTKRWLVVLPTLRIGE